MTRISDTQYASFIAELYEQGTYDTQETAIKMLEKVKLLFDIDEDAFPPKSIIISDANEWRKDHPVVEVLWDETCPECGNKIGSKPCYCDTCYKTCIDRQTERRIDEEKEGV